VSSFSYENLEQFFEDADRAWSEYTETVKRCLLEWERRRPLLSEKIAVLKARIGSNLKEIEELRVKADLGIIDEEKAQRKINALSEESVNMIHELETTWLTFERNVYKAILHMRRIGLPPDISKEDIESKLKDLESSFKRGIISSKDVFDELKRLLDEQLSLI